MAAAEEDVSDRDLEEISSQPELSGPKLFKCCSKQNKVCVCKNCLKIYHNSCSKRIKNANYVNDGIIECCSAQNPLGPSENSKEISILLNKVKAENDQLKMEIAYLKLLNEEMKDKNKILNLNNSLLMEKLDESRKNHNKNADKKQMTTNGGNNPRDSKVISCARATTISTSNENDSSKENRNGTQMNYSQAVLGNYMSDISRQPSTSKSSKQTPNPIEFTNIKPKPQSNGANQDNEGTFKEVNYRRNRLTSTNKQPRKNLGTAKLNENDRSAGFAGVERRVWMYLYRIKNHVKAETIKEYIQKHEDFHNCKIDVHELEGDPNYNKRFLVTAPIDKKDSLYDTSFWPEGVGIKRFDFRRHKEFLKKNFL